MIFQSVDSTGPTADHQASGRSVVIAPDIQNTESHVAPGHGPVITARLANEPSSDSPDHLTNAPAVAGKVRDSDHDFVKLTAGFDQAPAAGFIDLTSHINADGSFLLDQNLLRSMAGGTLAEGMHTLNLVASDSEGNIGTRSVQFTLDTDAPTLTARLADDTGASATDGITRDDTIVGTAADSGDGIAKLSGALDGASTSVNLSSLLRSNGTFVLDPAVLDRIARGGSGDDDHRNDDHRNDDHHNGDDDDHHGGLADGTHTLHLTAVDNAGNSTSFDVSFTLKTTPPAAPKLDLVPADVNSTLEEHVTDAASVTLAGTTDANVTVTLQLPGSSTVLSTISDNNGRFEFADVALGIGRNELKATATDLAGNSRDFTLTLQRVEQVPQGNAVLQWNQITLNAIQLAGLDPVTASRALAIESVAVMDTINAIDGTHGFLVQATAKAGASADAAVAAAAHEALAALFPSQSASLDAQYQAALAKIADNASGDGEDRDHRDRKDGRDRDHRDRGRDDNDRDGERHDDGSATAKADGIAVGTAVADQVLALRANDGSQVSKERDDGSNPGQWRSTGPNFGLGISPEFADVTPFVMSSADQFLSTVAPPPDLTSSAYASAVNEVQSLGGASSTSRTADQTQIAQFWSDGSGTLTEAGQWNQIASQVAQKQGDSLADDARLFGELNTGLADAGIAGWNAKYSFDFWRPVSAIENFTPLVTTPESPEYVETQSTFSAAAADILGNFFGQNVGFTATSAALPGVTRTYSSFTQAAQEAGRSGIFAGTDFQFSNVAGQNLGQNVGDLVLQSFDISKDAQPPRVLFDQPIKGIVTNTDPIITGHVLENLAGVASLQVKLDDGNLVPVSFDQTGKFSVPVNLPLDGSADGQHTLTFIATDALGKATSPLAVTFTLATKAPQLSFTNGLADGAILAAGSGMTGTVTTSAGVALAGLSYAFDNGTSIPVAFNPADKSFSQAFDLSTLAVGAHQLTVTATDAAGNVTVQTFNVLLPQLIPLAVTAVEPAANAGDVSVTFRPLVTFSRAVDPSTLNSNDFFLTDSAGNKLATTIVPWTDNMHAWLFPTDPLPGAQSIKLHIDGSQIKDAADGVALDAAGNGQAGSVFTQSFTTVDTTPVANTTISGQIVDPSNRPIAGVTVYVLGHENQQVVTDATGHFILTSVPAGNVKVETDGRTATNAPPGTFFPLLTVSLTVRPGQDNTIAGSRGQTDSQVDNTTNQQLVLPPVKTDTLTTLSQTAPTVLHTTADSSATLTPQQLQEVSLTVQPNTLIDETGKPMPTSSQVGISVISSDTVRDMLQPGVPRNSLVVTVSASGLASFTAPAVLTVPNVFGLPPGTKTSFLTFDYATGVTTIAGTCTVSADGKTIKTDPGTGITKPGWFTITPAGSPAENTPVPPCDLAAGFRNSLPDLLKDGLKEAKAAGAEMGKLAAEVPAAISVMKDGLDLYHKVKDFIKARNAGQLDPATVVAIAKDLGDAVGNVTSALTKSSENLDKRVKAVIVAVKLAQPLVDGELALLRNLQASNCIPSNPFFDAVRFTLEHENLGLKFISDTVDGIEKGVGAVIGKLVADLAGVILTDLLKPPTPVAPQTASPLAASLTAGATMDTTSSPSLDAIDFGLSTLTDLQTAMSQFQTGLSQLPPADQIGSAFDNIYQAAVGTPPNGPYAFFLPDGNVIRGHSDANGAIQVFLPPSTSYQFGILDPRYNMFAFASGTSAPSGSTTQLPLLHYQSFDGLTDTNGDGIPDIVKPILDLNPAGPVDQIIPGMTDLAAVDQGLDAASKSLTTTTGVIASVALQGEAQAVALVGAPVNGTQQTAYVATGSYGLAIVDATDAHNPIVLSQLKLAGTATDVAVGSDLHIAAVATGGNGLQLVNVEDPSNPALIQTVHIDATHVVVVDGIAYANDGEKLDAIDLLSGTVLQSLELGGQSITGLAREGSMLYTFSNSQTTFLSTIDISSGQMVLRGSAAVRLFESGKLFVGDGIAYVSDGATGYVTVDVSNPDQPRVLAANSLPQGIFSNAIALNGSGLGVTVGAFGPANFLDLVDTSDPTKVDRFITSFTLPANPFEVAIGEGTAFVADGAAGLQVVNYEATDTKGVAPTIQVLSAPTSVNSAAPGVELVEGQAVSFKVKVTDDVQVRNVELLATATDPNTGQTRTFVLKNSVSFPFDLSGVLPTIAALGGATQVTLQIAATDTGGNRTLSTPMVVTLVPDTTPLTLLHQSLADGEVRTANPGFVTFSFSKPLDPGTVNDSTFFLVGPDGSKVPVTVGLHNNGQTVELAYNQALALGLYQLEVDAANITDRVGNALGSNILTTHFTVSQFSDTWIGPQTGGLWTDAANWSAGRVPDVTDSVLVNLGPGGTMSVNNGDHTVAALVQTGSGTLSIDAGSLTVAGPAEIGGTLNVNSAAAFDANGTTTIGALSLRGTLGGTGTVTLTGVATVLGGLMTGGGTTVAQDNLTIAQLGMSVTDGRVLENQGMMNWTAGDISSDGSALLDNRGTLNVSVSGSAFAEATLNNGGSIEIGDGASVEFTGGGTQSGSFSGNGSLAFVGGTLIFTPTSSVGVADLVFTNVDATLAGAMTVGAGNQVTFTGGNVSVTGSITGAGNVLVDAPVSVGPTATYAVAGTTSLLFGTFDAEGAITIGTLDMSGGTLTGAGSVTVTGATTLTGGAMTGLGTTLTQGGLAIGGSFTIAGGRVLENQGVANWTGGDIVFGAGGGVFRNDVGAVFEANIAIATPSASSGPSGPPNGGGSILTTDPTGGSLFDNRGTFNQIGQMPSQIGVSFTNSGTLVDNSVVVFTGPFTDPGTLSIAAGATVSISGDLTMQSTSVLDIELGSSGGLLRVGGLAKLGGTLNAVPLAGFAPTVGQTFTFLTFATDAGAFATVTGTALGGGEALALDTSDATDLRFDVVSTAATTNLAKKPASAAASTATPPPVSN